MLIVNTDHGFFLSEHGWWGKGPMPNYEELVHTPLWIWNPRFAYSQKEGEDLLFDLKTDPKQEHPLTNEEKRQELLTAMAKLVYENDAPDEIYERYALEKPQRGADT